MKRVGLRELKNRLSEYVRLVRSGEVVLVTDRGEVVAELRSPGSLAGDTERHPGLLILARRGVLTLGKPNDPAAYPPMPRLLPPGTVQRLLDEERGER
jgi:antitoxin (DNA-binding transcriptional repressor) of toxin-antitoxin stability system